jgi:pyruvate dehydrogenase E2 component (dihydrolipoamide acetyltransferase)
MATNVTMPKLGLTMETGKIVEWKAAQGGEVKQGEILLIVETEKITYEVEAPASGLLHIIVPAEEEVPVAALIAQIAADKAELDGLAAGGASAAAATPVAPAPVADAPAAAAPAAAASAPARAPGERVKASPLAKKLAQEADIDISLIAGTGPEGRIVKEDVESYLASNKVRISPVAKKMADAAGLALVSIAGSGVNGKIMKEDVEKAIAAASQAPAAPDKKAAAPAEVAKGDRMEKLSGMRKVIARKMLQSCNEAAMAYMVYEIDATAIQNFREKILKSAEKKHGLRVTITDFMLKITAAAIRQHPVINTRWVEGEGILYQEQINIGMAMAIKAGLVVPVIKDTDNKSIIGIAKDRVDLIDKGRNGKLGPDQMTGGTFTLSAMGMFGTDIFTAIINQPENAILGVGTIKDKPVVVNGQIVIRPMMNLALTYDHRTIDGADAGRFMQTLKQYMEDPMMILAE